MTRLYDGILLYHGSYTGIDHIDLSRCFGGLDFGRGFYLTSSYEQAYHYVLLSVKKAMRIGFVPENFDPEDGRVSVYKFHYDPNILIYNFSEASIEWLHFVAANRKKDLFPHLLKKYGTIDISAEKLQMIRLPAHCSATLAELISVSQAPWMLIWLCFRSYCLIALRINSAFAHRRLLIISNL